MSFCRRATVLSCLVLSLAAPPAPAQNPAADSRRLSQEAVELERKIGELAV